MKGRGFRRPRGRLNTADQWLMHCLQMLSQYEEVTKEDMTVPAAEFFQMLYPKMPERHAKMLARAEIGLALNKLKRPQILCQDKLFPYAMVTKNDKGAMVWSRFQDWTKENIDFYMEENLKKQRKADTASYNRKRRDFRVLLDAMDDAGATMAGELDYSWVATDEEEDDDE